MSVIYTGLGRERERQRDHSQRWLLKCLQIPTKVWFCWMSPTYEVCVRDLKPILTDSDVETMRIKKNRTKKKKVLVPTVLVLFT